MTEPNAIEVADQVLVEFEADKVGMFGKNSWKYWCLKLYDTVKLLRNELAIKGDD